MQFHHCRAGWSPLSAWRLWLTGLRSAEMPGIYFEAVLKDETGKVVKTLKFPDDQANFWLRQRQVLLARALADDIPVRPPPGEAIAAPRQKAPTVEIWEPGPDKVFRLHSVPEHLVP